MAMLASCIFSIFQNRQNTPNNLTFRCLCSILPFAAPFRWDWGYRGVHGSPETLLIVLKPLKIRHLNNVYLFCHMPTLY